MSPARKTAKKKTTRKKSSRKRSSRKTPAQRARTAIEDSLAQLEKQAPSHLKNMVRDFRKNLSGFQKQLEKAQSDREARWDRLERQVRKDLASMLRRLEKAVEPGTKRKARPRKKKATTRTAKA